MAIKRTEYLTRQFHGRIADGDGHMSDPGLGANPFGNAERARENLLQQTAYRAFVPRRGIRALELAENLRLAHHHGIEAGCHAEEMLNRLARFVTVKMAFKCVRGAFPCLQEMLDHARRLFMVRGSESDLDAIAGGEDDGFRCPQILQLMQGFGQRVFRYSQLLAHVDRRGLVADSREKKLHWTRRLSRRKCAIQVTAEQHRAMMARIAALRPRQPALTRKKISAR